MEMFPMARRLRNVGYVIVLSVGTLTACAAGGAFDPANPHQVSQSERQQAAQVHPEILAEFGGAYTGPGTAMVTRVGKEMAVQSGIAKSGSECTVTFLNSTVVNAFAIPGCYIYVTRGLVSIMNDEAELASVLGHEIGHVAANHSQKRQNAALGSGLLSILTAVLTGNSQLGQLAGQIGQVWTLKYSRDQEYEADSLGIRYMTAAGYDPYASPDMLESLGDESALEAEIRGRDAAAEVPSWARTHPLTADRVARAERLASETGMKPGQQKRDARDYYAAVDGMLYGDDPSQGFVEGNRFAHPTLKIAFEVPEGYFLHNGATAVTATGGQTQIQFSGARLGSGDSLDSYISQVFKAVLGDAASGAQFSNVDHTTINGMDAARASARVATQSGQVDLTVVAYRADTQNGYHFIFLSPAGVDNSRVIDQVSRSFKKLSDQEASALHKRVVDVVTVKAGDTVNSLASRMAFDDYKTERFLTINDLEPNASLRPGEKVKLVVYG
jgi:predicted Zn-dependent protease